MRGNAIKGAAWGILLSTLFFWLPLFWLMGWLP